MIEKLAIINNRFKKSIIFTTFLYIKYHISNIFEIYNLHGQQLQNSNCNIINDDRQNTVNFRENLCNKN